MSSPIDPSVSRDTAPLLADRPPAADQPPQQLHLEHGSFAIRAQGQFHAAQGPLSVDWVDGDITLATLSEAYSPAMAAALARELGLSMGSGQPLTGHQVERARDMLQAAAPALEGVDFANMLRAWQSGIPEPQA